MYRSESLKETCYPESAFGGFSRVDGTIAFYYRVMALATPDTVALDVGCGRGQAAEHLDQCRILKNYCEKVIGIDVDSAGEQNPLIDEFRIIEGDHWPVESASIDLLVSDWVLEHLQDPSKFFAECGRVVKPGGVICFRTPNRWSYVSIAATIVPNRFHATVAGKVQATTKDVFPTYYRANTIRSIRRLLQEHDFEGCVYQHSGEPSYLQFSRWSYALGVCLHRWLPSTLSSVIFVFARRTTG